MKKKIIGKRIKKAGIIPPLSRSHEEESIASIFTEESIQVKNINLEIPPPVEDESYELIDYGLSKEESIKLWESVGKAKAKEFTEHIVSVMATLDAFKRAQDFTNKEFQAEIQFVTDKLTNEVANMLLAKLKTIILTDLKFEDAQMAELFTKYISRPDKSFADLLKTLPENQPYGAIGFSKGLKDD